MSRIQHIVHLPEGSTIEEHIPTHEQPREYILETKFRRRLRGALRGFAMGAIGFGLGGGGVALGIHLAAESEHGSGYDVVSAEQAALVCPEVEECPELEPQTCGIKDVSRTAISRECTARGYVIPEEPSRVVCSIDGETTTSLSACNAAIQGLAADSYDGVPTNEIMLRAAAAGRVVPMQEGFIVTHRDTVNSLQGELTKRMDYRCRTKPDDLGCEWWTAQK